MRGGIDLLYRTAFGRGVESRLQERIEELHDGELPVGQAVVLETGHWAAPFLIAAPTMRLPGNIRNTINVYLAFRAALRAIKAHNSSSDRPIRSVLSPGLGTGAGGMDYPEAARQMAAAYRTVMLGEPPLDALAVWTAVR